MSTIYGDISPRTAAYAAAKLLDRALPAMCMARYGQQVALPKNKTNTVKFRRYNGFAPSLVPLVEGVTPQPDVVSSTDVQATLQQYGRRVQVSDVIIDTHEDPVLNEYAEILGEVAGQTMELVVYSVIRAGTNVLYNSSNSLRTGVNAAVNSTLLNRMIRQLKRQNAKPITRMLAGTDKVGTVPIRPAFIVFCHPDLQTDLEAINGFVSPANYANSTNPTAGAPSNTALAANLPGGLGGQGLVTAAVAAATDGIWGSYQIPAGTANVQGRRCVIRGIRIDAVNTGAAVATTATTIQFSLAYGHTAVSLATAEAAAAKAPRRLPLGFMTWAVGAAIGQGPQAGPIIVDLGDAPVFVNPGEFVQLVGKFLVGTATASQVINFTWQPIYGWE